MISLLFVLMYCVWMWSIDDVLSVIQYFQMATVDDQCNCYMENNKTRDVKKCFKLRTNGDMNVRLCARIPFVIHKAAQIAEKYEMNNPNTTHAATLILVIFWEVFSDMRFVFYCFWKSCFTKNVNNERPNEIQQMIDKGFRSMYIAYNFCSIMVCILYKTYVCTCIHD